MDLGGVVPIGSDIYSRKVFRNLLESMPTKFRSNETIVPSPNPTHCGPKFRLKLVIIYISYAIVTNVLCLRYIKMYHHFHNKLVKFLSENLIK